MFCSMKKKKKNSITKFQLIGLTIDHGQLWSKYTPRFGISTYEKISNFVDKNLIFYQITFKKNFKIFKCINTNKHVEKQKPNLLIPNHQYNTQNIMIFK